jgi:RNA polymerase sigma-70 factor (ECF subfamily)
MTDDTLELSRRAAAGDRRAIDQLVELHLPGLRAFVRLRAGPLVRARESASDLVQSVCREVLEHGDRFRHASESAFRQWLYTTALRKIQHRREYWAAEKRNPGHERPIAHGGPEDDRSGDAGLLACYRTLSTPSRHAVAREGLERVERAFDALPEEYREVITLAKVVGLSRAEIAERTGKSEGAVRMLLHRALVELSGLLEERAN